MSSENSYQQQIASLERKVARLEDLVFDIVHCVEYRDDKPFNALTSQLMIYGDERIELFFTLDYICDLLEGRPSASKSHLLRRKIDDKDVFRRTSLSEPEAVGYLSEIVGPANAEEMLNAFRRQYRHK
ncbi:hypothetical protein [Cutibacterium sp.]|uniref:hypothetical protein n=1 Tax=Cutibacterium sp. TaxID=1912221 RepID=UPI0026DDC1CB|nr:hypothetical protein [Cutibacterium sp.]MDO4412287.1 hypothetical protein [Cutibacterium sp.]